MTTPSKHAPGITPGVVFGLFAIVAGVILLGDRQGWFDAHDAFRFFFPALLLAAGLFRLAQPASGPGRVWGAILTFAGIGLILDRLGYFRFSLWDLWPVGLIAIGVMLLWRSLSGREGWARTPHVIDSINALAAFGGGEIASDSKDFRGGEVMAIFGGYQIDLRQAAIQEGPVVLMATAVFGGIEIKVPTAWYITTDGIPILGGFSDHSHKPDASQGPLPRLIIRGIAVFGGVEIKN